ncbi:MAG TPA: hypothetical protein VFP97_17345 [Chitinophagaceae bacterium]|nr:hypothetical protein [Chitinophagaceae bacterium]
MGDFIKKFSDNTDPEGTAGVQGTSTIFNGVLGYTTADGHAGIAGACDEGGGNGVYGRSKNAHGVYGHSSAKYHGGVTGINDNTSEEAGPGVLGKSRGTGVWGESDTWNGVYGVSRSTTGGAGVYGKSETGCGVIAINSNPESLAPALYAKKETSLPQERMGIAEKVGIYAAIFDGCVKIEKGFLQIGNKTLENLLDELEKRVEEKMLRLIYELEDQLNITLPKS